MTSVSKITALLRQIIRPMIQDSVIPGKVISVDFDQQTCEVESITGKADFIEVKLKGIIKNDDTGFIIFPKVGSDVSVCVIEGDLSNTFICQYTEIDSWLVHKKIDGKTVFKQHLKSDGLLEWNDGKFGGLIIIQNLTDKLNTIESDMNDLKKVFLTSWVPAPTDGGAALKVAAATWAAAILIPTKKSEIEDKTIIH